MQITDVFTCAEMFEYLVFRRSYPFSEDVQGLICVHREDDMVKLFYRSIRRHQTDLTILLAHAAFDWAVNMYVVTPRKGL